MLKPPAYYPSAGATITIDAGIWSAAGRPTVHATVVIDARLLVDFVNRAAASTNGTFTLGLGNPRASCTLT